MIKKNVQKFIVLVIVIILFIQSIQHIFAFDNNIKLDGTYIENSEDTSNDEEKVLEKNEDNIIDKNNGKTFSKINFRILGMSNLQSNLEKEISEFIRLEEGVTLSSDIDNMIVLDNELDIKPYEIIEEIVVDSNRKERKIKLGVMSIDTTQLLDLYDEIAISDFSKFVKNNIGAMREEGANIIVLLIPNVENNQNKLIYNNDENNTYINVISGDADIVISGYSSDKTYETEKLVKFIQLKNNGQEIGIIDVEIDVIEDKVGNVEYKISSIKSTVENYDTKTIEKESGKEVQLESLNIRNEEKNHIESLNIEDEESNLEENVKEAIGSISKDMNSFFSLVTDNEIMQLVSDSQISYIKEVLKLGGTELDKHKELPILSAVSPFRVGNSAEDYIDIKAGDITVEDLNNIYKYDNTISVIKLTGASIKEWLEYSSNIFNTVDTDSKVEEELINKDFTAFNFDVIDGIKYEIDITKVPKYDKTGNTINENSSRIYNLTYNGSPLNLEKEFLIITNNYRAIGDNFPWKGKQETVYTSTDKNRDILKKYIDKIGNLELNVDNNWRIKPLSTETNVVFISHKEGVNYLERYPSVSTDKEVVGEGMYKYKYDLKYGLDNIKPNNLNLKVDSNTVSNKNKDIRKDNSPKTGDLNICGYYIAGISAMLCILYNNLKNNKR